MSVGVGVKASWTRMFVAQDVGRKLGVGAASAGRMEKGRVSEHKHEWHTCTNASEVCVSCSPQDFVKV